MYYRARYYSAEIGRFISQDPDKGTIKVPTTVNNKYIYVGNNPALNVDPSGKIFFTSLFAITSMVIGGATVPGALAAVGATMGGMIGGGIAANLYGNNILGLSGVGLALFTIGGIMGGAGIGQGFEQALIKQQVAMSWTEFIIGCGVVVGLAIAAKYVVEQQVFKSLNFDTSYINKNFNPNNTIKRQSLPSDAPGYGQRECRAA